MSAPLAHNLDAISVVGLHILCDETFETRLQRPLRLRMYERKVGRPLTSSKDLTAQERGKLARWMEMLRHNPPLRDRALRIVAADLAPDAAQVNANTSRLPVAERTDTRDQALSYLERIGEAGHVGRFGAGDCANLLLSLHPDEKPADVLAEFLAAPEMEKLKAFLCPKLPWGKTLADEDRLRYEETALNTLAELARVAARVPQRLRDAHPDLAFEWFRTSATAQECRDGRFVVPSEAEIERRLNAASDLRFGSLKAFRQWCRTGTVDAAPKAEKPDVTDEALAAFRSAFYSCDSVVMAWSATFGPGAPYSVRKVTR